jgi:hypothetical protein
VGNVVSGALWLLALALVSPALSLLGAAYVVAASVFLGAVYAHAPLTWRHEALAWAVPWLLAVIVVTAVLVSIDGGSASDWPLAAALGSAIATASYLAWQLSALAVRQLIVGLSGTAQARP